MSKVAEYLAEHILGEALAQPTVMSRYARDESILEKRPEMVLRPRTTSDVRKITTFCWQLAKKGHVLPLTARGNGRSTTGAAIGRGAIVDMAAHMHRIFEFELKQRLVRLQPGVRVSELTNALSLVGATMPLMVDCDPLATVGGVIADGLSGPRQTKHGGISGYVSRLEVVLANGDVIQTGRLSKREFNRRKGLETFEGEIYRTLDRIFEDKADFLAQGPANYDQSGYPGIYDVKQKNGSVDLTPLFVGSQGTLGIITEMILTTTVASANESICALVFKDKADARDAADVIAKTDPAYAECIDGALFATAKSHGKRYDVLGDEEFGAVIVVGYDDFTAKARQKKIKKLQKLLTADGTNIITLPDDRASSLHAVRAIESSAYATNNGDESWPPLFDHFYIPSERLEEFVSALDTLMTKYQFTLPLHGDILANVYSAKPLLHLRHVGDKQKVLKLINELNSLVLKVDGSLVGDGGEGRLHAKFAIAQQDAELREIYQTIKMTFDPHGILNPGVKQDGDLRDIVAMLRNDY